MIRKIARALFLRVDVSAIVLGHYRTLYNDRNGRPRRADYVLILGLPLAIASLPIWANVVLSSTSGLLAASSVLGGLLFALLILVLQMSSDAAARAETEGVEARLLRRVKVLRELAANVSYSVLIAIVSTVTLSVGEFLLPVTVAPSPGQPEVQPHQPTWFSVVVLFVLSHFVITLLMVLKRTFAVTTRELDLASVPPAKTARSGSDALSS